MTTLREAAQQALGYMKSIGQMDMYPEDWAIVGRLEAALAQQAEPRNQCGETCERAKLCATCAQALAQQDEPVNADAAYQRWLEDTHAPALRRMDSQGAFTAGWQAALTQQAEPVQETCTYKCEAWPECGCAPPKAEPVEPVAWWVVTFFGEITEKFQDKEEAENFYRAMQANYPQDAAHRKLITLYTAPPRRKPLTEEEIGRIGMKHVTLREVIRAVERAHGIKE